MTWKDAIFHRRNYWFLVPWISFIPWYGMLIAMLACWALQGHPIYWFMHTYQFPVYISDIGATNLRPLFISCSGWQRLGYAICMLLELWLRSTGRLQFWFTKHERNLIWASFILGSIGEIGLLMASIFGTAKYHRVHLSMVGVFIAFMFFSACCLCAEYFLLGKHYARIHPKRRFWNKFMVSGFLKTFWLICSVVWAACFGGFRHNQSRSAIFEWTLSFWLGVLFIIISWDFFPASKWDSKYLPYISNWESYYKYNGYLTPSYLPKDMDTTDSPSSTDSKWFNFWKNKKNSSPASSLPQNNVVDGEFTPSNVYH